MEFRPNAHGVVFLVALACMVSLFPHLCSVRVGACCSFSLRVLGAHSAGCACQGVYVQTAGPSFETAAECNMMRAMGGSAVGMSTVPEVVVARQVGFRALGFSLITNDCVRTPEDMPACHEEVLAAGEAGSKMMEALIGGIVERIGAPATSS